MSNLQTALHLSDASAPSTSPWVDVPEKQFFLNEEGKRCIWGPGKHYAEIKAIMTLANYLSH